MSIRIGWLAVASIAVVSVGTAQAQINGIKSNPRVFNDFSTSTLVVTNGNSVNQGFVASSATIDETDYTDDLMGGNFTNRHDFMLSRDNGAFAHVFNIDQSWVFKTIVTLDGGVDVPQVKEAGLRINSPVTGDALFLVKTNGEIAAFDGGAPFYLFSAGMGVLNDYIPGTPILLGMKMTAFGDGNAPGANTIEYFIDRLPFSVGGEETSGPLGWQNNEGGPVNYNLGMYAQGPPDLNAVPPDFIAADFNDVMFIPEPTTALMSIIGMLAGLMLRRQTR